MGLFLVVFIERSLSLYEKEKTIFIKINTPRVYQNPVKSFSSTPNISSFFS